MRKPTCVFLIALALLQNFYTINCNLHGNEAVNVPMTAGRSSSSQSKDNKDPLQGVRHVNQQAQHYVHSKQHGNVAASGIHAADHKNSYNLLSEAMSQAVSNEFNSVVGSSSNDGACPADDTECYNSQDRLSMEAIRLLHEQLDDDDNGNIDLSESDDFLREELKYDSGYEKRQKAFHFNDDMHISVKELWEAWLRSEVHNWTIEQTTDWLAQSVQLPQYIEIFKIHKVTGAALPRLAVNTMHYLSNVLGIKDPIHKQKIALKAMDVVLFGPPRETGTRWKDYILVTLLLSAIIGCWYAYQQNKNAKLHLRRMAQDMEGLQRAEQSLQEMQKELERARMEQENVASEKMDLERRLKEAPSMSSMNSELEVQQLKKEIEMLRSELSRAEIELVDNCWSPPPQLQQWLQYTYELENKNHQKKRISAEKQLQSAREACEKLRKKRSSFVGAFVSTHGKSIDDVDRSIVEARNALGEVTNELQERLHRWKQIETCLGFSIVNNNGFQYLETVLYGRNGNSSKGSRGRITNSTDDLDEDSIQGLFDSYSRSSGVSSSGIFNSGSNTIKDDSSCSDEGADLQSVQFYLGSTPSSPTITSVPAVCTRTIVPESSFNPTSTLNQFSPVLPTRYADCDNNSHDSSSVSECSVIAPPRSKKLSSQISNSHQQYKYSTLGKTPLPPPRKSTQNPLLRSQSTDVIRVPLEVQSYFSKPNHAHSSESHQISNLSYEAPSSALALMSSKASSSGGNIKKLISTQGGAASQSSSSTSSSIHSVSPCLDTSYVNNQPNVRVDSNIMLIKNSSTDLFSSDNSSSSNSKIDCSYEYPFGESLTRCTSLASTICEKTSKNEEVTSECRETGSHKKKRRLRFPFSGQSGHNKILSNTKIIPLKIKNKND